MIAEVETDKATMGFEAQDPGVVLKILVEPGQEIAVGTPIMVICDEDPSDVDALVAAFKDFTPDAPASASEPPAVAATPEPVPAPSPAPPPAPVAAPAPAAVAPPPAAVVEPPAPAVTAPEKVAAAVVPAYSPRWGQMAKKSPLAFRLAKDQAEYVTKYGSTGQPPIA